MRAHGHTEDCLDRTKKNNLQYEKKTECHCFAVPVIRTNNIIDKVLNGDTIISENRLHTTSEYWKIKASAGLELVRA
jgi:hypothetical protein